MGKRLIKEQITEAFSPCSLEELYKIYGDVQIEASTFGLAIFKYRVETDEEYTTRLLKEQKDKEEKDAQDRMTYLILKAKFEPNGTR